MEYGMDNQNIQSQEGQQPLQHQLQHQLQQQSQGFNPCLNSKVCFPNNNNNNVCFSMIISFILAQMSFFLFISFFTF